MVKKTIVVCFVSTFLILLFFSTVIGGTEADAHFQKGVTYVNQGDYQQAMEEFNLALSLEPDYVNAYCGIGVAYLNQKKYKEGIEALEKAIALDPEKAIPYYLLGMAYEQVMNYGEAIAAWKKFLALTPEGERAEKVRKHMKRLEEFEE